MAHSPLLSGWNHGIRTNIEHLVTLVGWEATRFPLVQDTRVMLDHLFDAPDLTRIRYLCVRWIGGEERIPTLYMSVSFSVKLSSPMHSSLTWESRSSWNNLSTTAYKKGFDSRYLAPKLTAFVASKPRQRSKKKWNGAVLCWHEKF